MGQKVNPIGLRLGVNKTWQSRWYAGPREYADLFLEDVKIRKLVGLLPECKNADIAEIEIVRHPQRVTIVIHTARPGVIRCKGRYNRKDKRRYPEAVDKKGTDQD